MRFGKVRMEGGDKIWRKRRNRGNGDEDGGKGKLVEIMKEKDR